MSSRGATSALAACALVACALAARQKIKKYDTSIRDVSLDEESSLTAQCPPDAQNCSATRYGFIVNGHNLFFTYKEGSEFEAECWSSDAVGVVGALVAGAWPRFPRPALFRSVRVRECAPPAGAYAPALEALNVLVLYKLELILPAGSQLSADAFRHLPPSLEELSVMSSDGGAQLAPGALDALPQLERLELERARYGRLPPALNTLVLTDTGARTLPPEALSVTQLTLRESNLRQLDGMAPRLEWLWLRAPAPPPRAPRLRTLWMCTYRFKFESDRYLNALESYYPPKTGRQEMGEVSVEQLPDEFLRGAPQLITFVARTCGIKSLPADLFHYSKKLETIYLADNKIKSLPSNLFAGLSELRTLVLADNRLSVRDLRAAPPPAGLRNLSLTHNPLGDLCPEDGVSILSELKQLETLELNGAGVSRVCGDWLQLQELNKLELSLNEVQSIACADLLHPRNQTLFINLYNSPVAHVHCSQEEFQRAAALVSKKESFKIWWSKEVQCECGMYWLVRVTHALGCDLDVPFIKDRFQFDSCAGEWLQCIGAGECGLDSSKAVELVIGGGPAERGAVPWHAAVYRKTYKKPRQICGGSLLSTKVVVSAAHCFWNDVTKKQPASRYAVALGKIFRRWDDPRDEDVQTFDLAELQLPERFQGSVSRFQADLALLLLATPAVYRPHIRPVCLDFDYAFESNQLQKGSYGKVAGWGLTQQDGVHASQLKTAQLPFVPVEECLADAPPDFKDHITADKICAGYTNGAAALCEGDSGGGLVYFKLDGGKVRAYLRGVVSTGPLNRHRCNKDWLTTFTLVSYYKQFVSRTLTL